MPKLIRKKTYTMDADSIRITYLFGFIPVWFNFKPDHTS